MSADYPEEFIRELEIVQKIIDRMARNSFMIKGWTITLVVISLLVGGQPIHKIGAFLPWLVFWIQDAYFLRIERCYRKLHEWLIVTRPEAPPVPPPAPESIVTSPPSPVNAPSTEVAIL